MSYPYLGQVQRGLYQALAGDAPLLALLGSADKVSDAVLHEAQFPYVTIHKMKQRPYETNGHHEAIITAEIVVYSDYNGMKEIGDIMTEICRILMSGAMVLSGISLSQLRIIDMEQRRSRDGLTREGIVTVEFFVEGA